MKIFDRNGCILLEADGYCCGKSQSASWGKRCTTVSSDTNLVIPHRHICISVFVLADYPAMSVDIAGSGNALYAGDTPNQEFLIWCAPNQEFLIW